MTTFSVSNERLHKRSWGKYQNKQQLVLEVYYYFYLFCCYYINRWGEMNGVII